MGKPRSKTIQIALGKTLRTLRERAGIAQETLALETGIGRSYMGGLERGLHSPSLNTIYRLLPALNVSFIEFAQEFEQNLRIAAATGKRDRPERTRKGRSMQKPDQEGAR